MVQTSGDKHSKWRSSTGKSHVVAIKSAESLHLGEGVVERGRRDWNVLNLDPDAGDVRCTC